MNNKIIFSLSLALLIGLSPNYSDAAIKKKPAKSETASQQDAAPEAPSDISLAFNPKPSKGDIELPMPNGLKMVLRSVSVPASDLLRDAKFNVGLLDIQKERGFYEKRMNSYVCAPFRFENLPETWKKSLSEAEASAEKKSSDNKSDQNQFTYYFIGKYEITNAQWDAVMGTKSNERAELPKGNISWYEVQEFLLRYNEWLLKEHAAKIKESKKNSPASKINMGIVPQIDRVPAYLRLPNEEEWEYAARGGNLPSEFRDQTDFYLADGKDIQDYAVFGSGFSKPLRIGSRLPNHLGLHDVAENVAEMVQGGFRFHIADSSGSGAAVYRLHGSEGGILCKGGSFLSASDLDVFPGKRVEKRVFEFDAAAGAYSPHKERSLGFRIMLASVNIPGPLREQILVDTEAALSGDTNGNQNSKESEKAVDPSKKDQKGKAGAFGKDRLVSLDPNGDILTEFSKIYDAASTPFMKSNLSQFRERLKAENVVKAREQENRILESIRNAAYQVDSMRNIAFRIFEGSNRIAQIKLSAKGKKNPKFDALIKKGEETIHGQFLDLEVATSRYRKDLETVSLIPTKQADAMFIQLRKEYGGSEKLFVLFRENLKCTESHINIIRKSGVGKLTPASIWKDILPKNTLEAVQQASKIK